MKFVEILKLNNDGTQRVIAVCKLTGNMKECTCEGDRAVVENLIKYGIARPDNGTRKLFLTDGLAFLEGLKDFFTSGYISVSEIKETAD
jgi:hypothetical protein